MQILIKFILQYLLINISENYKQTLLVISIHTFNFTSLKKNNNIKSPVLSFYN